MPQRSSPDPPAPWSRSPARSTGSPTARWREVGNGDARMTRVTALGCAASAVIGAFLTVEPDPLEAAVRALAIFGLAGERRPRPPRGRAACAGGFWTSWRCSTRRPCARVKIA